MAADRWILKPRGSGNAISRLLRKIVEEGTEEDLKLALRQIGLSEDSPEYAEALRIWRSGYR